MHSQYGSNAIFTGEMAEWSIAAVLKTVDCNRSGGSNPSFSAKKNRNKRFGFFCFWGVENLFALAFKNKKLNAFQAFSFLFAGSPIWDQ